VRGERIDETILYSEGQLSLRAHLPTMAEKLIGEHASDHSLAYRHGANADARIVTAYRRHRHILPCPVDCLARIEDG
jgi:hypothetical protein